MINFKILKPFFALCLVFMAVLGLGTLLSSNTSKEKASFEVMGLGSPSFPTLNKIESTTTIGVMEISDSVTKKSVEYGRGDLKFQHTGNTTGATVSIFEKHTGQLVYTGAVNKIRIVSVAQTDTARILAFRKSPLFYKP